MNERIVKLFMQSADSNYIPLPIEDHMPSWTEKFAELIVRECTKEIMYSSVGQEDPVFAYEYVKHLKTTFSIAE